MCFLSADLVVALAGESGTSSIATAAWTLAALQAVIARSAYVNGAHAWAVC